MPNSLRVAVDALSAHHAFRLLRHGLAVHVEVVLQRIGDVTALGVVIHAGGALGRLAHRDHALLRPVVGDELAVQRQQGLRLVRPGITEAVEVVQLSQTVGLEHGVYLCTGQEQCLAAVLRVDGQQGVDARLHGGVAPPLQAVEVFGVAVGLAAGNEVFQRGHPQGGCGGAWSSFLCHKHSGRHQQGAQGFSQSFHAG